MSLVRPGESLRAGMAFGMTPVGVYVVVHAAESPSNEAWSEYVADMERNARAIRGLAVYTTGGGPNAGQRKQVADMWARVGVNPQIVVITPHAVVRTIVTALNWFLSRKIQAFQPDELDPALRHLGVGRGEQQVVRKTIERLGRALDVPALRPTGTD